jgi:three-Cys-motif partner protein
MSKGFFREAREASRIKAKVVAEYFPIWAKIISKYSKELAYIDLFCGPGLYEDGTESTPILVLREAIANNDIRERFISIFTDKEVEFVESLRAAIEEIPGIDLLTYKPRIKQLEVGEEVIAELQKASLIPSLVFLDPCGYKGLSLKLINSILKDWACECIFFFNYNRINAAIHNDIVEDLINEIFGIQRADLLRLALIGKSPYQREKIVLKNLVEALKEAHGRFVQSFCVKDCDRKRTSHYLIFVTKNFTGYEIMREIMGKFSSSSVEGVPSFEFSKRDESDMFYRPLNDLKEMLVEELAGKSMKMVDIYKDHSPGRNYLKKNYKDALKLLFEEAKIKAVSTSGKKPRKGTIGDNIIVSFPEKG